MSDKKPDLPEGARVLIAYPGEVEIPEFDKDGNWTGSHRALLSDFNEDSIPTQQGYTEAEPGFVQPPDGHSWSEEEIEAREAANPVEETDPKAEKPKTKPVAMDTGTQSAGGKS